jgi:hypothetical protein
MRVPRLKPICGLGLWLRADAPRDAQEKGQAGNRGFAFHKPGPEYQGFRLNRQATETWARQRPSLRR